MRRRLLIAGLVVVAVAIIAVGAEPTGASSRLLTQHLLTASNDHRAARARGPQLAASPSTATPGTPVPHRTEQPTTALTTEPSSEPTTTPRQDRTKTPRPRQPAKRTSRVVYLTFDDGPGPATLPILSVLDRTGSTATFFQLGINARGEKRIQAAIREQGSNIGNHSYDHPDLTELSPAGIRNQIARGVAARCFRPPYGATNAAVRRALREAGARQVLWTVDTRDWAQPGTSTLQKIGRSPLMKHGSIILMHDGGGDRSQTVAALPGMIKNLHARGFAVRALPYC